VIATEWLGKPIIVISDPAAIRHVMVDNAKNYGMQPLRQRCCGRSYATVC